ncbi:MAG: S8 family peptidase [Desulfuromonadales bacterium]|jgi:subtilisin family serine protease
MKKILPSLMFILFGFASPSLAVLPPGGAPGAVRAGQAAAPFVKGQVLLRVKPGVSPAAVAATVHAAVVRGLGNGTIQLLELQQGDVPTAVRALRGKVGVLSADPNWLRQLDAAPDDSGFNLKWDLDNPGTLCQSSNNCATTDADIDWLEAYNDLDPTFSGSAVVAVIDTGIDSNHPDLKDKITTNGYDFLDNDVDPSDTYGHGTHVAGIALAETDNNTGTAGVGFSPNIRVMPLRVCDENGCPDSAIINALYYAADHGANVINLSLGGPFGSSAEQQAIDYAWGKGLVIAASSGNDGSGRVSYPAAFPNAIAVGATNWHDQVASYSNGGSDLDVTAPGGEMSAYHDKGGIYSTMPTYPVYLTTVYGYSMNYDQLQGTSMAAPEVSGLAALLFSLGTVTDTNGDGNTNDEIRSIIESTADDLGSAGWDRKYGWGRINAYQAVLAATSGSTTSPQPPPTTGGNLSVSVATNKTTYKNHDKAQMTATVTDGSAAVASAAVHFVLTAPNRTSTCDATTDSTGKASCQYTVNTRRDGVGSYSLSVTASKSGYTDGTASTTFTVQ